VISLRGRSFGSLQRRIARPEAHTSPAAKYEMHATPHHTRPSQGASTGASYVVGARRSTCQHAPADTYAYRRAPSGRIQHATPSGLRLSAFQIVSVRAGILRAARRGGKHGLLGL